MALFSESVNFSLQDVHLIFGPRTDNMNQENDFSTDVEGCEYDTEDQVTNIIAMHAICNEKRRIEAE